MDKPEPLLLLSSWGTFAIPLSQAEAILPHLIEVRHRGGDNPPTKYEILDRAMSMQYVPRDEVITMLVDKKLTKE